MTTVSDPGPEAVRAQLGRMLDSPAFARAGRMRRFLTLSVGETLAGRGLELKEYTVGVAVFDRGVAFDPAADPIVRVEARRLRSKIRDYYRRHGRGDQILIEIPKGAYCARFRWRAERRTRRLPDRSLPALAHISLPFAAHAIPLV
jgi:hypothetical protein